LPHQRILHIENDAPLFTTAHVYGRNYNLTVIYLEVQLLFIKDASEWYNDHTET
jgi:hypothetical protein